MKKSLLALGLALSIGVSAQHRYLDEAFQVNVTNDVEYGINVDFLTSRLTNPSRINADLTEIKTALGTGNPIPAKYFDPADTAGSVIKLKRLNMDIYAPANDTMTNRPVIVYIHTGNFLPSPLNGSPNGSKSDSAAITLCRQWAARGFVAVAFNYRHGWRPDGATDLLRRRTLLQAVYRAIHDSKQAVRFLKQGAATYGIDKSKITLYGQGSGGYVALAYATLDKFSEVELNKFIDPSTNESFVDTNILGNFEGYGLQSLSLYAPNGENSDIAMTVNAGGALADTSWLEAGDVPMISFQCLNDPFAPFAEGTVVVPTTQGFVVDVQGANVFQAKANALGNNDPFKNFTYNDPYTLRARATYNQSYPYYDAAQSPMVVSSSEGLFPFIFPVQPGSASNPFTNQGSPWEWWDPNSPNAQAVVSPGPPAITAHQASLLSNPDMSPTKGRTYLDTIQGYMIPRVMVALQLDGYLSIGLEENTVSKNFELYPNPTNGQLTIEAQVGEKIELLEVYDLTGRLVTSRKLNEHKTTIDLSNCSPGVYVLKATVDGLTNSIKFTKQ